MPVVPDEALAYGYTDEDRHFCRAFLGLEEPRLSVLSVTDAWSFGGTDPAKLRSASTQGRAAALNRKGTGWD